MLKSNFTLCGYLMLVKFRLKRVGSAWKFWWNSRRRLDSFQRKITTAWVLFSEGHILLIRSVSFLLDSTYDPSLTDDHNTFSKLDFQNMDSEVAFRNFLSSWFFAVWRIKRRMLVRRGCIGDVYALLVSVFHSTVQ